MSNVPRRFAWSLVELCIWLIRSCTVTTSLVRAGLPVFIIYGPSFLPLHVSSWLLSVIVVFSGPFPKGIINNSFNQYQEVIRVLFFHILPRK